MTRAEKAAMPRPLKLRALLARAGIKHDDIVPHLKQSDGRVLSRTSFSQWINKGKSLVHTPAEDLKKQVVKFLQDEQLPEADIASAFEPEEVNRIYAVSRTTARTAPRQPDIKPVETVVLSSAAKEKFGFTANPFPTDMSDVQANADVMLWPNNRFVLASMQSAARTGGLLAVVGESGAGKSVLRKKFLDECEKKHGDDLRIVRPRIIDKSKMTAAAVCEAIIRDLTPGVTIRHTLEARAKQVEEALTGLFHAGTRACLLLEEAHDIASDVLKFLKRFWEIDVGWQRPLAVVLLGQLELKDRLNEQSHPDIKEFIRRCEVAELLPITERIDDYLAFKLNRAGVPFKSVFAPGAGDAIRARLSSATRNLCYPLVINNLVCRSLNDAAMAGEKLITPEIITETRRV